jgi:hypothetical protein
MRLFAIPLGHFLLSNLGTRFCFRGRAITPRVSNLHDYVDHVFKIPKEFVEIQNLELSSKF